MANGTVMLLYVLLILNGLRFGTYIVEGNSSAYYLTMFGANFLALIILIIYRAVKARKTKEADITD